MIESLLPPHKHLIDLCVLLCCLLPSHSAVWCLRDSSQFLCNVVIMVATTNVCLRLVSQQFLCISKEKKKIPPSELEDGWSGIPCVFNSTSTAAAHLWAALSVCFPCGLRHITEHVSFVMLQTAQSSELAFKISFWNFSYQYLRL